MHIIATWMACITSAWLMIDVGVAHTIDRNKYDAGADIAGSLTSMLSGDLGSSEPTFADLEACVGCRFVWSAVKEDVGAPPYSLPGILDSFETFCQDMPDVFYESCDDMMDQKEWLAKVFIDDSDVEKLCDASGICGAQGADALFAATTYDPVAAAKKKALTG
eukprot:g1265.t1